jgi:hypothetical protein
MTDLTAVEHIPAWQCIGCGRIEAERPCIGICQDKQTSFVYASDFESLRAENYRLLEKVDAMRALVRQMAHTTPRPGKATETLIAFKKLAQEALREP